MKVMVYTLSSTTPWWRYIASQLAFASETVVVSDLPDADIDISVKYTRNLQDPSAADDALSGLGKDTCQDVIRRCRLLRVLDPQEALRMIGAMQKTIEDLLDGEKPDLFLSYVIDRYILDLFHRALSARGIRYVGMTVGIVPDSVMFMARGEYLPVREPSESQVDDALEVLTPPQFVPSYVSRAGFGLGRFLKTYLRATARWLVFEAISRWRRKPLDFRYLSPRWAACGYRVRLRDWKVMSFLDEDWEQRLGETPYERRVFVGMSVNPEAAIEYWLDDFDLVDYRAVLERLAQVLGEAGFHLFVKDHPSQFGYRQVELYEALSKFDAVTFVPYEVPGRYLIDKCMSTFTWTGTVGLEAALAGRCAIVDSDAYYVVDGLFLRLMGLADIDALPARIRDFRLPAAPECRRALARHILRSNVPGVYNSWRGFSSQDAQAVDKVRTLVDSLNRYLPALAELVPAAVRMPASEGGQTCADITKRKGV